MHFNNKGLGPNSHKLMDNSEQRADFERSPKNVDLFFSKFWSTVHTFLVKNCFSLSPFPTNPQTKARIQSSAHRGAPHPSKPSCAQCPERELNVGQLWHSSRTCHFRSTVIRCLSMSLPCSRSLLLLANRCSLIEQNSSGSKAEVSGDIFPVTRGGRVASFRSRSLITKFHIVA